MPRAQTYFRAASYNWSGSRCSMCINPLKEETLLISKRRSFFLYVIIQSQSTLNTSHQVAIQTWPISGCPKLHMRPALAPVTLQLYLSTARQSFLFLLTPCLHPLAYNKVATQHTGVPGLVDVCKTRWWYIKVSAKIPALKSVSLKPQTSVLIQILQSHYLFQAAVFCLDRRLRFFCKRAHICYTSTCKLSEWHMPDTCRTSRCVLATEQFLTVCFLLT